MQVPRCKSKPRCNHPAPVATPPVRALPPCQVTTAGGLTSGDCPARYINFRLSYDDIAGCNTGRCFARQFLDIDKAPMIVVYPQAPLRVQKRRQCCGKMVAGAIAMGQHLKDRVNSGAAGLPSVSQINSLVDRAIAEVDNIDQPVGESTDQRLRRLGLGPAVGSLARQVRDS